MRVENREKKIGDFLVCIQAFFTKYSLFINLLKPRTLILLPNRFKTLFSFCPTYAKTFP